MCFSANLLYYVFELTCVYCILAKSLLCLMPIKYLYLVYYIATYVDLKAYFYAIKHSPVCILYLV